MKRYIPIAASLMAFSLVSCGEVMDLTQPEKAEVVRQKRRGLPEISPLSIRHGRTAGHPVSGKSRCAVIGNCTEKNRKS